MVLLIAMAAGLALQTSAEAPVSPPVIRVMGHGVARTPPDTVTISMSVRGEGASSDDAVRALAVKREAIESALAGKAEVRTGKLSVKAARDKACDDADDDGDKPRLSTGVCAIRGYVAALSLTARVARPAEAGTLLGLAGRLGATDPSLEDFALREPAAARRAAVADAMRDGRDQAQVIAAASHVALGRLRRVEDQRTGNATAQDVIVTARRIAPAEVSPPIVVRLSPEPIQTEAFLVVEFEVGSARPDR